MHCFSASSVSCVTERLSGCKDTDLYWIRANYYLKKYYSTVAFSIILIAPLHVSQSMSCRQWAMWTWFHNLKADKIRKRISHYFGLQPIVLESWITSLTLLRNAYCQLFKSVEQSKLRHACLSKKKTFVEQTNHSPNDYEKVASDTIV